MNINEKLDSIVREMQSIKSIIEKSKEEIHKIQEEIVETKSSITKSHDLEAEEVFQVEKKWESKRKQDEQKVSMLQDKKLAKEESLAVQSASLSLIDNMLQMFKDTVPREDVKNAIKSLEQHKDFNKTLSELGFDEDESEAEAAQIAATG
jgi:chromosome segregation ATPase